MANSKGGAYTTKEVEEIGVFALPYIRKMYDEGNMDVLKHLQKLTSSGFDDINLMHPNNDWGLWFKTNQKEIDTIMTISQ